MQKKIIALAVAAAAAGFASAPVLAQSTCHPLRLD